MSKVQRLPGTQFTRMAVVAFVSAVVAFGSVYVISKPKTNKLVSSNAKCPQNVTCVAIKQDHAEPDVITVPVDGYAQFNSADGQMHNLGLGAGDEHHDGSHKHTGTYVSGDFKSDEAWKVQFKETGTFDFHDHYRPEIHVSVIVYKPGGDYKIK